MAGMKELAVKAAQDNRLADTLKAVIRNTFKAGTMFLEISLGEDIWNNGRTVRTDRASLMSKEEKGDMYAAKAAKRLWYLRKEFGLEISSDLNPYDRDGEVDATKARKLVAWALIEFASLNRDAEAIRLADATAKYNPESLS